MFSCRSFHTISNNKSYMDTLATIYHRMHVIECSGATLLLGAQPPDSLVQRYSQLPPLPAGPTCTSAHSYST